MNHTISDTDYVELSTFAEEQWHKVLNYLGRTFNLPREDCQDVFQDAFIVLYDQINEGRLTPLKCSLSTYFTSICRYKALELLRHNNRSITTDYTNLATDNDTNSATLAQQSANTRTTHYADTRAVLQEKLRCPYRLCQEGTQHVQCCRRPWH